MGINPGTMPFERWWERFIVQKVMHGHDLWQIRIQRAFGGIIVSVSFRKSGSSLIIVVPSSYFKFKPLEALSLGDLQARDACRVEGMILGDVVAI